MENFKKFKMFLSINVKQSNLLKPRSNITSLKAGISSSAELNSYKSLKKQSSLRTKELLSLCDKFKSFNSGKALNKQEFTQLYSELRPESNDNLKEIVQYIFECFDKNHDGEISFNEFITGYILTSRGYESL